MPAFGGGLKFNMKKIFNFIVFACCLFSKSAAQDFQFAQYFATPLLLNPALTGYIEGDGSGRVSMAYRSQHYQKVPDYHGATAMLDFRRCIGCDGCGKSRMFWAVGLLLQGDQSDFAHFSQARAGLSGAFHLGLGTKASMSVGASTAFFNYGFDPTGLRFDEQFDGIGYNASVGRPEPLVGAAGRQSELDLNAGVNGTFPLYQGQITAGVAFYHLIPVTYTLSPPGNQLWLGTSFYGTWQHKRWSIRGLWRRQSISGRESKQHQLLVGAVHHFKSGFACGMMARANNYPRPALQFDGLVPVFQLRLGASQWSASYDIPIASARRVTPGAFELSAQVSFGDFGRCVYCPAW